MAEYDLTEVGSSGLQKGIGLTREETDPSFGSSLGYCLAATLGRARGSSVPCRAAHESTVSSEEQTSRGAQLVKLIVLPCGMLSQSVC